MRGKFLIFAVLLAGCSPSTIEDLRCQGEAETRKLAQELKRIESKEALQRSLPRLRKRYNRIAALLLEARKFPDASPMEPTSASEELFVELARLYEIPGGREMVETAQNEAVHRLSK
jgi:nitric oxide reductase activation protein